MLGGEGYQPFIVLFPFAPVYFNEEFVPPSYAVLVSCYLLILIPDFEVFSLFLRMFPDFTIVLNFMQSLYVLKFEFLVFFCFLFSIHVWSEKLFIT